MSVSSVFFCHFAKKSLCPLNGRKSVGVSSIISLNLEKLRNPLIAQLFFNKNTTVVFLYGLLENSIVGREIRYSIIAQFFFLEIITLNSFSSKIKLIKRQSLEHQQIQIPLRRSYLHVTQILSYERKGNANWITDGYRCEQRGVYRIHVFSQHSNSHLTLPNPCKL